MTDQSTAEETKIPEANGEKKLEENQDDTEVISIRAGRLLKLKHKLRELRKEALSDYSKELEELKSACNNTNALLGELNDGTGGQEAR